MSQLHFGGVLGEGGAGIVYDGIWQGRDVAIKKLTGHFTHAADREMQLISRLEHDNVIRYYTMEKTNTAVFLVMELVLGGTLFDYIREEFQQRNYWTISHKILRDIADGMNYLHGQNIVHGDLKSNNILLRQQSNEAVICDFGLSKTLTTAQTQMMTTGSVVPGTTRWLAPELCRSRPERPSHKSDVWAFGCIILEITSANLPWINCFETDDILRFALQDSGSHQAPMFTHECNIQMAPTKIRRLLCSCCRWPKMTRPNFATIMNTLNDISFYDLENITQSNQLEPPQLIWELSRMPIWQHEEEQREAEERRRQEQEWNTCQHYCPNCGEQMVKRENSFNNNAGGIIMSGVIIGPFEGGGDDMNTFGGHGSPYNGRGSRRGRHHRGSRGNRRRF